MRSCVGAGLANVGRSCSRGQLIPATEGLMSVLMSAPVSAMAAAAVRCSFDMVYFLRACYELLLLISLIT
jgi:hypothetical protein